MADTTISHLDALEAESIHIFREVAAEFEHPVLLFSGGKDSAVMLKVAEKAFWPARIPFPLMHVDTGHNFPEVIDYRDRRVAELGVGAGRRLGPGLDRRRPGHRGPGPEGDPQPAPERHPPRLDRGARVRRRLRRRAAATRTRPGPRSASYSFRDEFGQWDPKNQRPELWNLYNGRHRKGEHIRVFPISNWTEMDVWQYIEREDIELPSIYYSHRREVFRARRHAARGHRLRERPGRRRGRGDDRPLPHRRRRDCTGAVESPASNPAEVIIEVAASRITERGATRADDKFAEAAMEDRKKEGYF